MTKSKGKHAPRHTWTTAELLAMRTLYPDHTAEAVANAIQVSTKLVYRKAKAMGLCKSPEFIASARSGRIARGKQDPRMAATRFQPGLTPWNKGAHYSAGGRSAETQFRPGSKPHTWLPIGSLRIIYKNLERKENDLPGPNHVRWHPVHRTVWIKANGPVPKGHVVVFRPGMHTAGIEEISLDRIECISRAENVRRNHPRERSPELAKLVQLKGAITRQVNRIVREAQELEK